MLVLAIHGDHPEILMVLNENSHGYQNLLQPLRKPNKKLGSQLHGVNFPLIGHLVDKTVTLIDFIQLYLLLSHN